MKFKHIILPALALAMFSCNSGDGIVPPGEQTLVDELQSLSNTRSVDEAVLFANQIADATNGSSRRSKVASRNNVTAIVSHNGRSGQDTLLYAVNYGDGEGFAMIAAPKNVAPVLAFTEQGDFGSDKNSTNESFQYAVDLAKDYVQSVSIPNPPIGGGGGGGRLPFTLLLQDTTWHVKVKIEPRVKVKWSQYWPENIYCPNHIAGCAPVAIAQIATYFQQPTSIVLTFPGKDKDTQLLDWPEINKHLVSSNKFFTGKKDIWHLLSCEASEETHYVIGRFVRQIGVLAKSEYQYGETEYENTTGTTYPNAFNAIQSLFQGKNFTEGTDVKKMYDLLYNGGVMYVRGEDLSDPERPSYHVWLADGVIRMAYTYREYTRTTEPPIVEETVWKKDYDYRYIHCNWGCGGDSNGYFLEGIFDMKKREYADEGTADAFNKYNYDTSIRFFHIK